MAGDCDDAVKDAYAAGERDALAKLQKTANECGPSVLFAFKILMGRYRGLSWSQIITIK